VGGIRWPALIARKKCLSKSWSPWRLFFNLGVFAHAAEMKKISLGYSTVGPAGTGLWMAKEIGAPTDQMTNFRTAAIGTTTPTQELGECAATSGMVNGIIHESVAVPGAITQPSLRQI
jgi:hypothetical protein